MSPGRWARIEAYLASGASDRLPDGRQEELQAVVEQTRVAGYDNPQLLSEARIARFISMYRGLLMALVGIEYYEFFVDMMAWGAGRHIYFNAAQNAFVMVVDAVEGQIGAQPLWPPHFGDNARSISAVQNAMQALL